MPKRDKTLKNMIIQQNIHILCLDNLIRVILPR